MSPTKTVGGMVGGPEAAASTMAATIAAILEQYNQEIEKKGGMNKFAGAAAKKGGLTIGSKEMSKLGRGTTPS